MNLIKKLSIVIVILMLTFSFACKGGGKTDSGTDTGDTQVSKVKKIRALIKSVTGKAVMYKDGQQMKLKAGIEITKAEAIETFASSKCTVLFSTGSTLSLQEKTKVKIKILLPKGIKNELQNGGVLMNVKKLTTKEDFSVSTPTAVAGVRGTQFYVSYNKDTKSTKVAVREGKVNVAPKVEVSTNDETKKKIEKVVSVDLTQNQTINLEKKQVEEINKKIDNSIKDIEKAKTEQEIREKIIVKSSTEILKKQKVDSTTQDKKVFEDLPQRDVSSQADQVLVTVSQPDAAITVNGKTSKGLYSGYHEKGAKLNVKVEKKGFETFSKEYTVPEEENFAPEIELQAKSDENANQQTNTINRQPVRVAPRFVWVRQNLPRVASKFDVGIGSSTQLFTNRGKVFFVGKDRKFYIVNMNAGGSIVKTIPINAEIRSTPLFYQGVVYFGAMNQKLYAIRISDGKVLFTKSLGSPLAMKNTVAGMGNMLYSATPAGVYKINRLTGKTIWHKQIGGENVWSGVAVDNKHVYVADEGEYIRALKVSDGEEVWKQKLSARPTLGKVLKFGNKVVINLHNGSLAVVSASNGRKIPVNIKVNRLVETPYQHGALAFYPSARGIKIVNLATLKEVGFVDTQGKPKFNVHGRDLYAGVGSNELKKMNLSGAPQWSVNLGTNISHNPTSDALFVYAITDNGTLFKINKRDFIMIRRRVQ